MKKSLTIRNDGFEGFRKRSRERARKLDRGESLDPEKIITFDDAFKALTPARILVIRQVKEREMSITSLADSLNRRREAVSRDVTALQSAGILKVRQVTNPGHGKLAMVSAAAKTILVEI